MIRNYLLSLLFLLNLPLSAQVTLGQSSAPNAAINYLSGLTAPVQAGAALPSTCPLGVGQLFFLTTGMPGQNVYACTSASPVVWTLEAGGGTTGVAPSQQFNVGYYPGSGTTSAIGGASTFEWCQTGSCGPNSTAAFISAGQPISSADSAVLAGVFYNPTVFNYNSSTRPYQSGYEFINGNFPLTARAQAFGRGNGVEMLTDCTSSAANGGCYALNVIAISSGPNVGGTQLTGMPAAPGLEVFALNIVATDQNSRVTSSAGYQSYPVSFLSPVETDCIVSNPGTAACEGFNSKSLNSLYQPAGTFSAVMAEADSNVPGYGVPYQVPWKIGFHCVPGSEFSPTAAGVCMYMGSTVRNNSGTLNCSNTGAGGAGVCTIAASNEDFHRSFAGQQLFISGSSCANSVCTIASIGPLTGMASNTITLTAPTGALPGSGSCTPSPCGSYWMYGKSSALQAESYGNLYGAITYTANLDETGTWNEGFNGTSSGYNGGYAWYGENQLLMNLKQINATAEILNIGQTSAQTGELCLANSQASTNCQVERNLGVTALYYHNVPLTGAAVNGSIEVWPAATAASTSNQWAVPSGNGLVYLTAPGTSFAYTPGDGLVIASAGNISDIGGQPVYQIGSSDLTGQTASIGTQTVATAPAAGFYKVWYYALLNTPCTTGSETVSLAFNWNAIRTLQTAALTIGTTNLASSYLSGTFPVYLSTGNFTYSSTVTGSCSTGTASYDVHVRLDAY